MPPTASNDVFDITSIPDDVRLLLIRGVAGTGKSTLAREQLVPRGFKHFETDHYFEQMGKYSFEPRKLAAAHEWCQNEARQTLWAGEKAVVSNTFTRFWEMSPYIDMARLSEVRMHIIDLGNQPRYTSIHNIDDDIIQDMINRYEIISP